jgi:uncharacterized cupredoxin-like copper-binding protein
VRLRIAMLFCAVGGLAVVGAAVSATNHATTTPRPVKITVKMTEFSFTFSKASVKAGTTVTFTVKNVGQVAHDLSFTTLHKTTPLLQPGSSAKLKVLFKKKGRYAYLCTVPRHAQQGMAGSFVVTK